MLRLKNPLIEHGKNLHHFRQIRNIVAWCHISGEQFNQYNFVQLNTLKSFSTTRTLLKGKDRGRDKKKSQSVHTDLNELAEVVSVEHMMQQFDKAIEQYKDSMIKHVTLRTSIGAIEELMVKCDEDEYQLQEIVQIARNPKLIKLDASIFPEMISHIHKALSQSSMNLNPQQEGTTIYIQIPKVTKEHRENLAKTAKIYFVKCKDNITNVRNKYTQDIKKKKSLPIDLASRATVYVDNISHEYIDKADKLLKTKQKELLGDS
ncbi:Ribosome-recycling factor, mitochondrial [Dufourea novaeangliae]|uniref:Ribosome-recycling factor, mitochondrial n=2 Tax=Dufourea novaeangliae TaxID=178035 RepID=A0A154NW70_DUFNO|nr:Ribosome-recycling factor, mitochondrial [Dufourea novaeangliae]